jgi:hypothetical protein
MGQVGAHEFYANQFPAEVPPDFELNSLSQILWFVLRTHSNGLDGALLQALTNTIYRFKRIGLEAGPLSQWLYSVLAEAGLPVICVETRHMRAVLKAQINQRLRQGETQADIARTYNVDPATISRLAAASPFEYGAVAVAQ